MGGAKNFQIQMEHDLAKEPEVVYLQIRLNAAEREAKMLREHLKWLEVHHKKMTDHLLNILSLNKIALP